MSFIVEKYPTLPPDRFTLFNLYYGTVCDREISKDIPIARYLSDNRQRIDRLHEQVGLVLQAASETADGAEAALEPDALGSLAAAQLRARGFDDAQATADAARLVEAAMQRLVLLTPRDDGVGFEIRSLQELMAARAITEGTDEDCIARLRISAHSPHWRNTWLLATGNLLLRSERFEKAIGRLLRHLDTPEKLDKHFPTAPTLAADLLEDNLAARRPNFERALVQRVLTALDHPPVMDLSRLAQALHHIANTTYRAAVFDRLNAAAAAGTDRRAAAALVLDEMSATARNSGRRTSIRIAREKLSLSITESEAVANWRSLSRGQQDSPVGDSMSVADYFIDLVASIGLDSSDIEQLRDGVTSLAGAQFRLVEDIAVPVSFQLGDPSVLMTVLGDDDIAVSLDLALENLPPAHWAVGAMLGAAIKPALSRDPIGPKLLKLFDDSRPGTNTTPSNQRTTSGASRD